ncbi:MAG: dephospho-CoA kinase [Candidatus Geothermincolia bacterium]
MGLTGGLGSGKSTVAEMLRQRGARIIDADAVSRRVTCKGREGYEAIVAELGPEILGADGELDRAALAERVFEDPERRVWLESMLHPLIMRDMAEELERARNELADEDLLVMDVPLLVETGMAPLFRWVIVVLAEADQQVARAVRDRSMDPEDAWARIRSQASVEERLSVASYVIENNGTLGELERRVEEVWSEMTERAAEPPPG